MLIHILENNNTVRKIAPKINKKITKPKKNTSEAHNPFESPMFVFFMSLIHSHRHTALHSLKAPRLLAPAFLLLKHLLYG